MTSEEIRPLKISTSYMAWESKMFCEEKSVKITKYIHAFIFAIHVCVHLFYSFRD